MGRFEGVERGVMGLPRLWKGVEKCPSGFLKAAIHQRRPFVNRGSVS